LIRSRYEVNPRPQTRTEWTAPSGMARSNRLQLAKICVVYLLAIDELR